jgi:hypothetical protein
VAFGLGQLVWSVLTWARPSYDAAGGLLHRPTLFNVAVMLAAIAALLVWYLLLRHRLGPVALVIGGLTWHALLGVVCAAYAPGAAFLFTAPALLATLGVGVALLVNRPLWSVVALAVGSVVGSALLPYFGYMVFGAVGMSLAGVGAVFAVLFGLLLLPAVELLLPEASPRRRTVAAIPATALVLSAALVAAGLAIDSPDATHPAPTHLAYVLDVDTGKATWVSAEQTPGDWTANHVDSRNTDSLPDGYQRGELWTGPAPAIDVEGPEVTEVTKEGNKITFHVRSPRNATAITLRLNTPITGATARTEGAAEVSTTITGTRKNTWPAEIRFRDLPPEGVTITVETASPVIRVTAIDETRGFPRLPDLTPRPGTATASTREDGDLTAVARTYNL